MTDATCIPESVDAEVPAADAAERSCAWLRAIERRVAAVVAGRAGRDAWRSSLDAPAVGTVDHDESDGGVIAP